MSSFIQFIYYHSFKHIYYNFIRDKWECKQSYRKKNLNLDFKIRYDKLYIYSIYNLIANLHSIF